MQKYHSSPLLTHEKAKSIAANHPLPTISNLYYHQAAKQRRRTNQDDASTAKKANLFQAFEAVGDSVFEGPLLRAIFFCLQIHGKLEGEVRLERYIATTKNLLRSNHCISELAFAYGLHHDTSPPFDSDYAVTYSDSSKKWLGDCFEAYVGALVLSGDDKEADVWLLGLFKEVVEALWDVIEFKMSVDGTSGPTSSNTDKLSRVTPQASDMRLAAGSTTCGCHRAHLTALLASVDSTKIEHGYFFKISLPDGTLFQGRGPGRKDAEASASLDAIAYLDKEGVDFHRCGKVSKGRDVMEGSTKRRRGSD